MDSGGLVLHPFRALRPTADADRLGRLLCPPYDVIDPAGRKRLLAGDPDNAVAIILPDGGDEGRYAAAAQRLDAEVASGLLAVDPSAALYVYEMQTVDGGATRGLVGAVELRDPDAGVILPHENTMAGPVADRLALMTATEANLEPIYLVYDGGGAASRAVAGASARPPLAVASTPDGVKHRLWALTDGELLADIAADLRPRRALIADGHHRYATYRDLQQRLGRDRGPGPWDRGLTLLVDSSAYGPQVHAIHRVVRGLDLQRALNAAAEFGTVLPARDPSSGLSGIAAAAHFCAVLTDGSTTVTLEDTRGELAARTAALAEDASLARLDVTVLHRCLIEQVWGVPDTVDRVGYAHSIEDAIAEAAEGGGVAVLLRPTPVDAVAAVAAAGARMPRKSTLFTPKPASGLVMRRFADER